MFLMASATHHIRLQILESKFSAMSSLHIPVEPSPAYDKYPLFRGCDTLWDAHHMDIFLLCLLGCPPMVFSCYVLWGPTTWAFSCYVLWTPTTWTTLCLLRHLLPSLCGILPFPKSPSVHLFRGILYCSIHLSSSTTELPAWSAFTTKVTPVCQDSSYPIGTLLC